MAIDDNSDTIVDDVGFRLVQPNLADLLKLGKNLNM